MQSTKTKTIPQNISYYDITIHFSHLRKIEYYKLIEQMNFRPNLYVETIWKKTILLLTPENLRHTLNKYDIVILPILGIIIHKFKTKKRLLLIEKIGFVF